MATLLLTIMVGVKAAHTPVPSDIVLGFYREIVKRHPLGIPPGEDKRALWPFLSTRLVQALGALQACEDDYFEGNRRLLTAEQASQLKPTIGWMEYGLFSGGVERTMPTEVVVTRVTPVGGSRFRLQVQFTDRDTLETYGRPPDNSNTFHWTGLVVVVWERGHYAIDDFRPVDPDTGKLEPGLSDMFAECRGGRWVGDRGF